MTQSQEPDLFSAELPGRAMHDYLRGLRERGPVQPGVFAGAPAWVIVGHVELTAAFKDEAAFPAGEQYKRTIEPSQGRTFQGMDGREHHLTRQLATPAFKSRAVSRMEDHGIRPLAHELVDSFAGAGRADLVADFTRIFPFLVISRMLGIPRDCERAFFGWAEGMLAFDPRANKEFTETLLPVLAARRREPQEDVVSELLHAELEGRRFSDEEVLSHVRLLFAAGATTTYDATGGMLYALLTQPEVCERVRDDTAALEAAVEELLRWETPVANLPRITLSGASLGGVEIPARATAVFSITAANRDPEVFLDPDRFDLDRDSRRKLTFGLGSHSCPGLHLARKEIRIACEVLLERLPGLRLLDEEAARPRGGALRGPRTLPVAF